MGLVKVSQLATILVAFAMPDCTGPPLHVLHQNVADSILQPLVRLLGALFPESVIELKDGSHPNRVDTTIVGLVHDSRPVFVIVSANYQWLNATRTTVDLSDSVGLYLGTSRVSDTLLEPECFSATSAAQLEEFLGLLAQKLRVHRALNLGSHRGKVSEIVDFAMTLGSPATHAWTRRLLPLGAAFGFILIGTLSWKVWSRMREPSVPERFGFENGSAPWQPQIASGSLGCVAAKQSARIAKTGSHSLEVTFDLSSVDFDRRSGEVWAPVAAAQTRAVDSSIDLRGRKVAAWVMPTSEASGQVRRTNGFQLFVKDANWRSCYGPWTAATPNEWQLLELRIVEMASGQHVDHGFDGRNIAAVGIKLAMPTDISAKSTGSVYVDSIGW